ncbi:MaoC/PaaZ C-terminal domain-containing protein [Pedobacter sp. BMA]|uniref:MaoC/PaaZ C-terminal domain-containing protein n=1 Tax=Pedobacter sp. BMA TaxID=1663685 RepID=UPI00064B039B|nr:MaoC/PaaZ C-terminal domain-containing protein [Pedobacter sp. BMA]KLT63975.1 acyl dehydratase [Pedobacter sp. BMA]
MVIISSFEEYKSYLGIQIGQSKWHKINQQQTNRFADATDNYTSDNGKAKEQAPVDSEFVPGYLTLSLIPYLWKQIADIRDVKMEVNYGIENFKFNQEVRVDDEVMLRAKLISISDLRGITKVVIQADLDIKGSTVTAYTGNVVFLYHFN